jgi:hypothetical protein
VKTNTPVHRLANSRRKDYGTLASSICCEFQNVRYQRRSGAFPSFYIDHAQIVNASRALAEKQGAGSNRTTTVRGNETKYAIRVIRCQVLNTLQLISADGSGDPSPDWMRMDGIWE